MQISQEKILILKSLKVAQLAFQVHVSGASTAIASAPVADLLEMKRLDGHLSSRVIFRRDCAHVWAHFADTQVTWLCVEIECTTWLLPPLLRCMQRNGPTTFNVARYHVYIAYTLNSELLYSLEAFTD